MFTRCEWPSRDSFGSAVVVHAYICSRMSLYRLAAGLTAVAATESILGNDPTIIWQGRKVSTADGPVVWDWEGVQAMFSVSQATTISATLNSTFLSAPKAIDSSAGELGWARRVQDASFPKFGM